MKSDDRHPRALTLAVLAIAVALSPGPASAQGITTAAIAGRILDTDGHGLPGAEIAVTNQATGIAMRATSRSEGRYIVRGLEVGGPYAVSVRRLGSSRATREGFFLSLAQQLQVDVVLWQGPTMLQAVETRAPAMRLFSPAHTGVEWPLGDSAIHQMPVINRDLYDLIRLVPQMSTWFALTPSGVGPRANNILIDGIIDQVPSSNLAAGQLYGGKVIPLDAVKEYEVEISPFDVQQGGFAGAGVNVVTRSGTNTLHGSVFGYGTNDRLGPNVPLVRSTPYEKEQFGLSLGGPIVHDHLLFFFSSEIQRRMIPALGPFLGEGGTSQTGLPVRPTDITRFQQLLGVWGLDAGSAGPVTNANPSSSTFLRFDAPIARWNSRVTLRASYGQADSSIFARPTMLAPTDCPTTACFPLSSLQHSRWLSKRTVALQLLTNFANGFYNDVLVGYNRLVTGFNPTVQEPLILVTVPGSSGAPAVLQSGTHEIATGQRNVTWETELTDNLSFSKGPHRFTLGLSNQIFDLWAFQLRSAYGVWEFSSLDSLADGTASRYRITRDTGSVTAVNGGNYAAYASDSWELSSQLSLTFGVRADAQPLSAHPPYVPGLDSIFHLRTDRLPAELVQWSPRFGFNYRMTSEAESPTQLRGGIGLFTGRAPLFWLFGGFAGYGLAARTLQCGTLPGDVGPAPAFRPSTMNPPQACAGGQSFAASGSGEVDVIDPALRMPQTMRASLGLDAALPLGMVVTIENLYTRATEAIVFTPINLAAAVATDSHGRVMYGSVGTTGVATPNRVASQFSDVIQIVNQSKDHAYDATGTLRRPGRFADVEASISVGQARDVESPRPVSALLTDNWRFSRPVAGRENDLPLGISDFDQPVRVRLSGTLHSPWRTLPSEVSLFYVGGSGFPYTYVAGGTGGRGDLNADGAVGNDPIYIPRSSFDATEILFAGTPAEVQSQQAAFDRFVDGAQCLRAQRGHIMARNSCRSPWMSLTNLAVRQTVPSVRAQWFVLELQIFNILNLIDSRWGREELPTGATLSTTSQVPLLSQVGQTAGPQAQPIYRFDPTMSRYTSENLDTYYQIQLAVRYTF